MKPFGFGSNRFTYERPAKPQRNTVDFNQMISVRDVELTAKREAFRDTIRMHKKAANAHANANFISNRTYEMKIKETMHNHRAKPKT